MNHPLVSIIIPAFNAIHDLPGAIQSAFAQSYRPIEVIVVDDGSTDDTSAFLSASSDTVRWFSGPNRGASAARNKGYQLSKGDFIQFLDADNILRPTKIQLSMDAFQNQSADVVFSDEEPLSRDGQPLQGGCPSLSWTGGDAIPMLLSLRPPIQTTAALHRRSTLERVGLFDESLPCCQDLDLHLRLAAGGATFVHIRSIQSGYKRVPGSVSSNYRRVLEQHAPIILRVRDSLAASGGLTEERKKAFAELLARDGRQLYRLGEKNKAQDHFRLAKALHASSGLTAFSRHYRRLAQCLGPMQAEGVAALLKKLKRPAYAGPGGQP